jgi:hypothetical protein
MWTTILVIAGLIVAFVVIVLVSMVCQSIARDNKVARQFETKIVVLPAASEEERVKRVKSVVFNFCLQFFVAPMFLLHPAVAIMAWPVALVIGVVAALASWFLPLSFVTCFVIVYVLCVATIARDEYKREFGVEA